MATGGRVVALAASVSLGAGAAAWATWVHVIPFVAGHEYFRLRTIHVACDNPSVPAGSLAQLGGLYDDTSLWQIDPPAVEERLGEQSWVRRAHVSRSFPWKVSVDVARRRAVAATVTQSKVYLVDGDGVLFQEVQPEHAPDLVYLTGWDQPSAQAERASRLRTLLAVLREADRRSYKVSELHIDADAVVWMFPADMRASVRLGTASRISASLDRLAVALKELAPVADQLRSIDADFNDRVVVRGADDKLPALVTARLDRPVDHLANRTADRSVDPFSDPPTAANPPSPTLSAGSPAAPSAAPSIPEAKRRNG